MAGGAGRGGSRGGADPVAQRAAARAALAEVEAALLQRWPESRIDPTLDRILALSTLLGDPQRAYPSIHITGTNGKTSTARMIDTLLLGFGVRTGRVTSPHLSSITERISVDGRPLSPERFVEAYRDVEPFLSLIDEAAAAGGGHPLSYFEVVTAMAFAHFADAPVDAAVIEVGMGGTWDATNVVAAPVSVVTPISVDHAAYLGRTVTEIAQEKAGIIHPGQVAVLGMQPLSAATVLMRRAAEVGADVVRAGLDVRVLRRTLAVGGQVLTIQGLGGVYEDLMLPLHGPHQADNALVALAAVESFLGGGRERLDADMVREAFAHMTSPGRLEIIRRSPTVIVDAAHNPAGATVLAAALRTDFTFDRVIAIIGVMADKDAAGLLTELEPVVDHVIAVDVPSPRSLPADELATLAGEVLGPDRVTIARTLVDAYEQAVALLDEAGTPGGGIVVTGSVVLAGAARDRLSPPSDDDWDGS